MERSLSVTEINHFISTLLSTNVILKRINVEGEISNFKYGANGHFYFTLKDQRSRIAVMMFKTQTDSVKILPHDGMKVFVKGKISVYEPSGQYQIIAQSIEPSGIGDLYAEFERLKEKLSLKGWFSPLIKKQIPTDIKKIGIVTSDRGAAVHDMISVLNRRDPKIQILLVPALVQGIEAPQSIINGIYRLNKRKDIDVIIISRGGGSIEDLWAFNDENVAEAVYYSNIPIISAVGHETDFTIADFVSDLRAPTPSAAAELISEDIEQEKIKLSKLKSTLRQSLMKKILDLINDIDEYKRVLKIKSPERQLIQKEKLLAISAHRVFLNFERIINNQEKNLSVYKSKINCFNPAFLLNKGYVYVVDSSNLIIKKVKDIKQDEILNLHFSDGIVPVTVVKESFNDF